MCLSVCCIRTPCQVGYVQYIRTFTHSTLSNSPWLLHTHQTVWESESDTNYAETVGICCRTRHIIELLFLLCIICTSGRVCYVCSRMNEDSKAHHIPRFSLDDFDRDYHSSSFKIIFVRQRLLGRFVINCLSLWTNKRRHKSVCTALSTNA